MVGFRLEAVIVFKRDGYPVRVDVPSPERVDEFAGNKMLAVTLELQLSITVNRRHKRLLRSFQFDGLTTITVTPCTFMSARSHSSCLSLMRPFFAFKLEHDTASLSWVDGDDVGEACAISLDGGAPALFGLGGSEVGGEVAEGLEVGDDLGLAGRPLRFCEVV